MSRNTLWIVALAAVACSDGSKGSAVRETAGPPDSSGTDSASDLPEPLCTEGSRWSEGQQAFTEVTAAWGLEEIAPEGVWISAVDFDGDGWTDLVVRNSSGVNDYEAGSRANWLLRNDGAGSFVDVTQSSGLWAARTEAGAERQGWAMVFGDVDNDGDLDAYSGLPDGANNSETSEIYLNNGDGSFSLGPESPDFRSLTTDIAYGVSFTDVDRDGALDLWTTHYNISGYPYQDELYSGDGSGDFDEITSAAGLITQDWYQLSDLNEGRAHTNAWSAATCDLNNDGAPELLGASYGRAPNHLWRNNGSGAFTNVSVASGYAFDHRTDWTDNESARCWCHLHPTDEDCEGVPEPEYIACESDEDAFRWDHNFDREPFRLGGNSGATVCADVDNDGWMDLLTTEIVHWDVGSSSDPSEIAFNTGDADVRLDRPGNEQTGLLREYSSVDWNDGDMSGGVFDFDNDGWQDVYIGSSDYLDTRGWLFHQQSARSFTGVPVEQGIDHTRSHGFVSADFDRDGDLDVVVGHSSMRCESDCYDEFHVRMFENVLGQDGNWVQLALEGGEDSNRSAIGARVEITAGGITQSHEVDGGHGIFGSQSELVQHFGLGEACEAEVRIRWPDSEGSEQSFQVVSGYRFAVRQGEAPEVLLPE